MKLEYVARPLMLALVRWLDLKRVSAANGQLAPVVPGIFLRR